LSEHYFSISYQQARQRFRAAAERIGAKLYSYPCHCSDANLIMDVAIVGAAKGSAILISSGLHGIEGFAGSAIQLAWLEQLSHVAPDNQTQCIFIHAINPYGFTHLRRTNEENIDLNRNFLHRPEEYQGAPAGYRRLDPFLNPKSAPHRMEFFRLKVSWQLLRLGMRALKESIAAGQYEFPNGLFFGGNGPALSTRILQQNCEQWLDGLKRIVHLDIHTGLGRSGTYKLLISDPQATSSLAWYNDVYGSSVVEPLSKPGGTAYAASGIFGSWMQHRFSNREYRAIGAEFGTVDVVRILAALRAENRVHHYDTPGTESFQRAKRELLECFCPASKLWRSKLIESGKRILEQTLLATA
jgi:Protein of unknown function (DUF2817)